MRNRQGGAAGDGKLGVGFLGQRGSPTLGEKNKNPSRNLKSAPCIGYKPASPRWERGTGGQISELNKLKAGKTDGGIACFLHPEAAVGSLLENCELMVVGVGTTSSDQS